MLKVNVSSEVILSFIKNNDVSFAGLTHWKIKTSRNIESTLRHVNNLLETFTYNSWAPKRNILFEKKIKIILNCFFNVLSNSSSRWGNVIINMNSHIPYTRVCVFPLLWNASCVIWQYNKNPRYSYADAITIAKKWH